MHLQTVYASNSSFCDKIYSKSIQGPQNQCNKPNWQDTEINYQKKKKIFSTCVWYKAATVT